MKDSPSWLAMRDMNFEEIVNSSNIVFDDWKNFQSVLNGEFSNSILKPVNNYVKYFGIKPEINKIKDNHYSIIYKSYSEIFLSIDKSNRLYAVEKSWLRQFYPSSNTYKLNLENSLSENIYRFFIPWFIDEDIIYEIKPSNSKSIIAIESSGKFNKADKSCLIKDTGFVDFYFTKSKDHMISENVGLIKRGTPLYEIHLFTKSDISARIEHAYV